MVEGDREKIEAVDTGLDDGRKKVGVGSPSSSTLAKGGKSDSGSAKADEEWDPCAGITGVMERGRRALSGRSKPPTNSRDEESLRELANYDAIKQLVCLNRERFRWVKRMQGHLEGCCDAIKAMSYFSFVLGWLLILVPLLMFFFSDAHDTSLLWFSGIGLAETLAILVYRPIDRVQEATSDMAQGTLIMNSWATEIGLILYLTDLPETKGSPEKTSALVKLITEATGSHVEWFQHFTEARNQPEKGEKKPDEKGKKASAELETQQPVVAPDPKKNGQPSASEQSQGLSEGA